eukprot:TRINITY_DN6007_c0_g1_i1.p1 TRINITY_DN6007_c0_g1~~TRINITY_DN6007_c0_g1_i1.p1  ORF type:complete len:264 (+),score=64.39 TRINITY_DN6007_c0_g1_i1:259-1050(+)
MVLRAAVLGNEEERIRATMELEYEERLCAAGAELRMREKHEELLLREHDGRRRRAEPAADPTCWLVPRAAVLDVEAERSRATVEREYEERLCAAGAELRRLRQEEEARGAAVAAAAAAAMVAVVTAREDAVRMSPSGLPTDHMKTLLARVKMRGWGSPAAPPHSGKAEHYYARCVIAVRAGGADGAHLKGCANKACRTAASLEATVAAARAAPTTGAATTARAAPTAGAATMLGGIDSKGTGKPASGGEDETSNGDAGENASV